jgi:hypothetical protein
LYPLAGCVLGLTMLVLVGCASREAAPPEPPTWREQPEALVLEGDTFVEQGAWAQALARYERARKLAGSPVPLLALRIAVSHFGARTASAGLGFGRSEATSLLEETRDTIEDAWPDPAGAEAAYFRAHWCLEANRLAGKLSLELVCEVRTYQALRKAVRDDVSPSARFAGPARLAIADGLTFLGADGEAKRVFSEAGAQPSLAEQTYYRKLMRREHVELATRYPRLLEVQQVTRGDVAFLVSREFAFLPAQPAEQEQSGADGHEFAASITWINARGLVFPDWGRGFEPNRPIERREWAMLAAQILELGRRAGMALPAAAWGPKTESASRFTDLDTTRPSNPDFVAMVMLGVIEADGPAARPYEPVSGVDLLDGVQRLRELLQ